MSFRIIYKEGPDFEFHQCSVLLPTERHAFHVTNSCIFKDELTIIFGNR